MINSAGIDLGGTKIEASVFDENWQALDTRRLPTPQNYADLIDALVDQFQWISSHSDSTNLPIGLGAPGRLDRKSGLAFMANVAATGKPLQADLTNAVQRDIAFGNDCDMFAFSEANLGAGKHAKSVFGLILGTGIGGGICFDGVLHQTNNGTAAEVGHIPLPAGLVAELELPLLTCGCGRVGCFETLGSGPGMARIAKLITGQDGEARDTAARAAQGDAESQKIMQTWAKIIASLIGILQVVIDPDCVVLGGGLSNIPDVSKILSDALKGTGLRGSIPPEIVKAAYGDSSGTRGAALLALQKRQRL